MRTRLSLLMLLLVSITGCASGDEGVIVYGAFDGKPQPELVVVDTSGQELHRIRLPDTVRMSFPTQLSQKAVIETFNDRWYLVDAAQGTLQEVVFPEEARGKVFPLRLMHEASERHWTLFGEGQGHLAYLVNLETGQVSDLTAGITEGTEFYNPNLAMFAPAEDSFVVFTSSGLWLVPTVNPGAARRLGPVTPGVAGFLDDGQQFVHCQIAPDGWTQIIVEQTDGSKSEVVATFREMKSARVVPGKRLILLAGQDGLSTFSVDDRTEHILWERAALVTRVITSDGRKALAEEADTFRWIAVDLERGVAQPLDALTGYRMVPSDVGISGRRWQYFIDSPAMGVVSLDLQTGETHEVLTLGEDLKLWRPLHSSPDGRLLALATVRAPDNNMKQIWLLNAQTGEARLLAEGTTVDGRFSPDGQWVAVSTFRRIGDREEASVTLMSSQGTETRPLGSGIRPVWVQP